MTAGREMFGKSYFSLGPAEKGAVDQTVNGIAAGNFQAITPEFLTRQQAALPRSISSGTTALTTACFYSPST
jgi:hypothetical protein